MYVDRDNTDRRRWFRAFRRSLFSSLEFCFYNSLKIVFLGLGYLVPIVTLLISGRPSWWVGSVLAGAGVTAAGGYSVVKNGATSFRIKGELERVIGRLPVEKYNYRKRDHIMSLATYFFPMSVLLLDYSHEGRVLDCLCAFFIIPMWAKHHVIARGLKKYEVVVDKEMARLDPSQIREVSDVSIKNLCILGLKSSVIFLRSSVALFVGRSFSRFMQFIHMEKDASVYGSVPSSSSKDSLNEFSSAESTEEAVMRKRAQSYKEVLIILEQAICAGARRKGKIDGMAAFLLSAAEQFANLTARQEQVGLGLVAFQAVVQRYAIEHNLLLEEEISESLGNNVQEQDEADKRVVQDASGLSKLVAIAEDGSVCRAHILAAKKILPEPLNKADLGGIADEEDEILKVLTVFRDCMVGTDARGITPC